eukprot:GHRR01035391.1.p1 GENE.GHRR01035391.1~~GHRR01035391.1.p1  ORF type:complete len:224 (+),score=70.70 GHRR01035391.1:62-733(+)
MELVQVDLSDKPGWYRTLNPQGLVPAVVYQNRSYVESLNICRWLDETFADQPLTPSGAEAKQLMEHLLGRTSMIVSAGLDLVAGSTSRSWGIGMRPSNQQQQRFEKQCAQLINALQQQGGLFLTGSKPSLADVALFPFFERFQVALQLSEGYDIFNCYAGAIGQWMSSMRKLDCCASASPNLVLFAEALKQHQSLDFFDYVPYTAYQLHPHLRKYVEADLSES